MTKITRTMECQSSKSCKRFQDSFFFKDVLKNSDFYEVLLVSHLGTNNDPFLIQEIDLQPFDPTVNIFKCKSDMANLIKLCQVEKQTQQLKDQRIVNKASFG